MATATAYYSVNMDTASTWYGDVTIANSRHIQISNGGYVQNYYGSFTYDRYGLTGGTVTSTNYYEFGTKVYEISGGSYSALTVERYVNTGNMAGLFSYVFAGNDTFNGSAQADVINGFAGNDNLRGNGGNDLLKGGIGNDTLNGGSGADRLIGGAGNDVYYVDNIGDKVFETTTTGGSVNAGGADRVISSVSFSLSAYTGVSFVENLTLSGSAAINATGNGLANALVGNSAANILRGGNGNDTLVGGGGADTLYGDAGNDLLRGGAGSDVLNGGTGQDAFRFDTALGTSATPVIDRIRDFSVTDDTIQLENSIFTKLGTSTTGAINPAYFRAISTGGVTDSNDYLVYNKSTGALLYDANGGINGLADAIHFATLSPSLALTSNDFVLV